MKNRATIYTGLAALGCPHCNKAFKIDEAGYTDILNQVRDNEFEKQLHKRLELAENEKRDTVKLAKSEIGRENAEDCYSQGR